MTKRIAIPVTIVLACLLTACSAAQWQKNLTVVLNVIQKDLPIAVQFVTLEHNAGNMSNENFAKFNAALLKVNTALPIFQQAIAGVKDAKGAAQIISALIPSVNDFIASGIALKNPQTQAKAIAWANGFALVINAITAAIGGTPVTVPVTTTVANAQEQKQAVAYFEAQFQF